MNGEDLSLFRDMSKKLYQYICSYSWSKQVERLGFDEVFLDVTDIVHYNMQFINPSYLWQSFFHLDSQDPEKGFTFDCSIVAGRVYPPAHEEFTSSSLSSPLLHHSTESYSPTTLALTIASHLAMHLRTKIEQDFDMTVSCGISSNKLLSKLVGNVNKPRNQTTLIAPTQDIIQDFLDVHILKKVPGVGFRTIDRLEKYILSKHSRLDTFEDSPLTVRDLRIFPGMSPTLMSKILQGPGNEKSLGAKIWALMHGTDLSEVKKSRDIPTQISIEDTYNGINTLPKVIEQLHKLGLSLLRRMYSDLTEESSHQIDDRGGSRWIAYPRTLRLTINTRKPSASSSSGFGSITLQKSTSVDKNSQTPLYHWSGRKSRSQPLPSFVFTLQYSAEYIVEKLVAEAFIPMFRWLNPEKQGWNLTLINVCVSNMKIAGNDNRKGAGRDISVMFKKQNETLKKWTVYDTTQPQQKVAENFMTSEQNEDENLYFWQEDGDLKMENSVDCLICGYELPSFAMEAHLRYHKLGD